MNENMRNFCIILLSLPVWERGLKFGVSDQYEKWNYVAPRVGAWIEICYGIGWNENKIVAPRVGAWIEISFVISSTVS